MALPLDASIDPDQTGHVDDHETIATVLNGMSAAGDGSLAGWDTGTGAFEPVTRAALAADSAFTGGYVIPAELPGVTSTSGRWIGSAANSVSAQATTLDRMTASRIYIPASLSIDQLAVSCTVLAASSSVRLGIYTDSSDGPGTLVAEAATAADTTTTGVKTVNITASLTKGKYWLAAVAQGGTPTLYQMSGFPGQAWGTAANIVTNFAPDIGVYRSSVSGALPSPFAITGTVGTVIRIAARIA